MGYKEEKQRQLDMRYLRMARIWAETNTKHTTGRETPTAGAAGAGR